MKIKLRNLPEENSENWDRPSNIGKNCEIWQFLSM